MSHGELGQAPAVTPPYPQKVTLDPILAEYDKIS